MRKSIQPYTFIYYIKGHRLEISFGGSSSPSYWVTSVRDTSSYFSDFESVNKIEKKINKFKANSPINLMLKLNSYFGEECMAFNHNA